MGEKRPTHRRMFASSVLSSSVVGVVSTRAKPIDMASVCNNRCNPSQGKRKSDNAEKKLKSVR
jgi:hypothetical protein